jgi:O-antigen ligase
MLILWIALIGFAIDEDLTFGARTSASDYVLPFLTLSALWLARKHNMPFIPPRVKPWMFLALWVNAMALVHGALRVGSMTAGIVLSSLLGLVVGYAIVCVVYSKLSDIESMQQSILIFIVAGSIWSLMSLAPYILSGGGGRLAGTNANAYGMFVSIVWICQLAYLISMRNPLWRFLFACNLLLLSAGIIFSGSRAAWGSCLLALPLMIVFFASARARGRMIVIIASLLIGGWVLYPGLEAQGWLAPVGERLNYERGLDSRLITDEFALSLWTASPFTILAGIGTGVYRQQYAYFTHGAAGSLHNTYTALLVQQGPLGLIAWLGVFGVALRGLWQSRRSIPIEQQWLIGAVAFSVLAVLWQAATHDTSNQRHLWLFVGLALAMSDKFKGVVISHLHGPRNHCSVLEVSEAVSPPNQRDEGVRMGASAALKE